MHLNRSKLFIGIRNTKALREQPWKRPKASWTSSKASLEIISGLWGIWPLLISKLQSAHTILRHFILRNTPNGHSGRPLGKTLTLSLKLKLTTKDKMPLLSPFYLLRWSLSTRNSDTPWFSVTGESEGLLSTSDSSCPTLDCLSKTKFTPAGRLGLIMIKTLSDLPSLTFHTWLMVSSNLPSRQPSRSTLSTFQGIRNC